MEPAHHSKTPAPAWEARHWHLLGVRAQEQGNHESAVACLQRAIALDPEFAEAYSDLGNSWFATGRVEEAAQCYRRALALNPFVVSAHYNLGNAWLSQGKANDAIDCYQSALALKPDYAEAHNNLGNALFQSGQLAAAACAYERAIELSPAFADAHHNLGNTFEALGKFSEALGCQSRAIELRPDFGPAHFKRATLRLRHGDFEQGWPEYEWRWTAGPLRSGEFHRPHWDGESLPGKTILLHAEQGFGDTFQFVRYAPLVRERCGGVILACQPALQPLLCGARGIDTLVTEVTAETPFAVHAPLASLPRLFGTTVDTIPESVPYLLASPPLVDEWRRRLAALDGWRIGINWRGRGGEGLFRLRDIPLECFEQLAKLADLRFIGLQKDISQAERTQLGPALVCPGGLGDPDHPNNPDEDFDTVHGAFMDTAAIMMNLDLVITSDTASAHLAGALGVPVWLALPFVPDWRWLLNRSDSPWYPTMRLFRQPSPGDWAGVFAEIEAALRELIAQRNVNAATRPK